MEYNKRKGGDRRAEDFLRINSQELQKNFHNIYKDFFNTHDIVLSGNTVLTWGADISHGMSSLRIKQKLPVKIYCGVNFNNSGKVTFRRVVYYSVLNNFFKESEFTTFFKNDTQRIVLFLQDFLIENGFVGGMEIDFLAEVPRGHGFSFSSVVAVLLTFLLHIVTGKISMADFQDRLLLQDHPLFDLLYQQSVSFSDYISHGKSSGASNFAIMIPNYSLPIVCFSKKNSLLGIDHVGQTHQTLFRDPLLSDIIIHKDTLTHILGLDDNSVDEIPLDYGILFTGMEYHMTGEIVSKKEQARKDHDHLNSFAHNILASLPIKEEDRGTLSKLLALDRDDISRKAIDGTNLRILEGFDALLRNKLNDIDLDAFINTIKNIGFLSFSYQKENKLFLTIQYLFYTYRQFEDEEIGILPFNTGKVGGSLFFVMKHRKSRVTLKKVLDHLYNDGSIASLDYASWRDKYGDDGIRLEQFITQKIYSEYTKEGNVLFTDTSGLSYFGDYETILEYEKDCILLDTIRGRIYIRGMKLTSKEIHSQNTTIDMMRLLIENLGKEVSNSKLPVSTYSQNKNEILSKVVSPIKKLAREYFGKEISLVCSGGITDYYLRLERDDGIRIGIIKKILD